MLVKRGAVGNEVVNGGMVIRPGEYFVVGREDKILLVGGKGRRVVIMIEMYHWLEWFEGIYAHDCIQIETGTRGLLRGSILEKRWRCQLVAGVAQCSCVGAVELVVLSVVEVSRQLIRNLC